MSEEEEAKALLQDVTSQIQQLVRQFKLEHAQQIARLKPFMFDRFKNEDGDYDAEDVLDIYSTFYHSATMPSLFDWEGLL